MYYSTYRNLRIGIWLGATAVVAVVGLLVSVEWAIIFALFVLVVGGFGLWVSLSIAEQNLAAYDGITPLPGWGVSDLVDDSRESAVAAYRRTLATADFPDFDSNELDPPTPTVRCPSCGAVLARYAAFCDTCGRPMPRAGSSGGRPSPGAPPSPGTP